MFISIAATEKECKEKGIFNLIDYNYKKWEGYDGTNSETNCIQSLFTQV